MDARGAAGRVVGGLFAPFTWLASLVRGERIFHPDGVVYRADVRPLAQDGALGRLAQGFAGTALVRLSGGARKWPKNAHSRDWLGVAVRLQGRRGMSLTPRQGDADLLFVTARSLLTLPVSIFRTNVEDFLANEYQALLPFTLEGVGKAMLRLRPDMQSPPGANRRERLAQAVAAGTAIFRLEARIEGRPEGWTPIAEIDLRERLEVDQERLRFLPGRAGMGIAPRGVLQRARPLAYLASQAGRRLARRLGRS